MSDRLFCIDFGSAYTKVGLRPGAWSNSDVVTNPALTLDGLRFCHPSAVFVDNTVSPARPAFGEEALGLPEGPRRRRHLNWKKKLLAATAADLADPPATNPARVVALVESDRFARLAGEFRVSAAEVVHLRKLVSHAAGMLGPDAGRPRPESPAAEGYTLAVHYFTWLRKQVLEACGRAKPAVTSPELIPARVTVPAFVPESHLPTHPGFGLLARALRQAGWPLHPSRPVVSEPYANAIGVLTRGSNCTRPLDMFQKGLLATALSKEKQHPSYRAVVIDLGAYTLDLAVLDFHTGGKPHLLSEVAFDIAAQSVPLGVCELDDTLLAAVPPDLGQHLKGVTADEWINLRQSVYAEEKTYPLGDWEVGGEAVRAAVRGYAARVGDAAKAFLDRFDDIPFKELILTGGGCAIPAVRAAVRAGAESNRTKLRKVHFPKAPSRKAAASSDPLTLEVELGGRESRGATAFGGTSAFFDLAAG
ncbi:MAG: hypothetical protein K2X87_17505 [Gemmataceae bacterium]|nr:hypothetical protein [Gemmataceae bacterium]